MSRSWIRSKQPLKRAIASPGRPCTTPERMVGSGCGVKNEPIGIGALPGSGIVGRGAQISAAQGGVEVPDGKLTLFPFSDGV